MNNTNDWITESVVIGPDQAAVLLSGNTSNRRLRRRTVDRYADIMRRGEWLQTPETISVGSNGVLLNGQHRLLAVMQSGTQQTFLLVRGVDPAAFRALDRGVPRTVADALDLPRSITQVANIASRLSAGVTDHRPTDVEVGFWADILRESHDRLREKCPSEARVLSSASVRLAACLADVLGGHGDYARGLYRDMVLGHLHLLPPVGLALYKSAVSASHGIAAAMPTRGGVGHGGKGQLDMLLYAYPAFDPDNAHLTRLVYISSTGRLNKLRTALNTWAGVKP